MSQKITKNILEEILKLYERICSIKLNDFDKLISVKKSYYNLFKTCRKFNQLDTAEETDDIDFLKRDLSGNFIEEIKKLEKVLYNKLQDIFIDYSINKNLRDYYQLKFFYAFKKFHQFYYNSDISKEELKLMKSRILTLKKTLPPENKIPNDFKRTVIQSIKQQLELYKNIIAKDYYEIRNIFRWYNKEIRIYFNSIFSDKTTGDILIYTYITDKNSIYIYPKKITVLPSQHLNIEEINKEIEFSIRTIYYRKFFRDKDYLKLTEISPLDEVINLFWKSASRNEQLELLIYFYELLGYRLKNSNNHETFYLNRTKFENINVKNLNGDVRELLFFPKNTFFDSSDLNEIIHSIKTKNILKKDTFLTLFSANNISLGNKKSPTANISLITLKNIASILAKLKILNLFNPYLKRKILEKNPSELKLIVQNEIKGEKLLKNVADFNLKEKTWKQFEELVENVFYFLFKDSFKTYYTRKQYSDYKGHRRYDLLIANVNPKIGFWKNCKNDYNSKIIIVDFKNYNEDIGQDTIHMFSKYLNNKKGNFGIIVSKSGINKSGEEEQRIKYFDDNKLIIHLSSEDLLKMISYKKNNQSPEDILDDKIISICTS